jgi:hypothetical protein
MQAFKAANPGCILEDFIKWHSPKDITDSGVSERMKIWVDLWTRSEALPVSKQELIFNYEIEAENTFKYFETLQVDTVLKAFMGTIIVFIYEELEKECDNEYLKEYFSILTEYIKTISWDGLLEEDFVKMSFEFSRIEDLILKSKVLQQHVLLPILCILIICRLVILQ